MSEMKKKDVFFGFCLLFVLFAVLPVQAQNRLTDGAETQYRRSSLYSLLIAHPQAKYASQIDYVYLGLPTPDKYEDHNLNVRRVEALTAKEAKPYEITAFLDGNQVARRLVAKWFNRDSNGVFNVDLVADRGNYNATEMDVAEARMTKRGLAMLSDAGEDLIGNTFVTVNDIVYIDKEQRAQLASAILQIVAQAALVATAAADDDDTEAIAGAIAGTAALGSIIADNLAGFKVKVTTHLYQLVWNDSIANLFYSDYWVDEDTPEAERLRRKALFEQSDLFALKYLGKYKVKSEKTVMKGVHSNEDIIRKVCARAMDRNIAGLQKKFEAFKVKTPVIAVENGRVVAKVGKKEGLKPSTKFEVLQPVEREDGRMVYRRVGVVKPQKGQIWDNRYMAFEEQSDGSELTATTFRTVSGVGFVPGMLIRQLK